MLGDTVPLDYNAFRWQWDKARKAAGEPKVRFHDLRHAFASALISGGCSVKAVWPGDEDRIRSAIDIVFAAPRTR